MEENDAETCCLSSIGVGTQSTGMSSVSDCDGHFLERYPQSDFQSTLKFQIEDHGSKTAPILLIEYLVGVSA